ncbi:MAG: TetR/AcrR family transcriptional regulator [Candidatus Eremiobacteraeota bacterium]|nr:TetR/AcrR family transcriptional regulator [Candidatus Eremiobacteraeota bacterium]
MPDGKRKRLPPEERKQQLLESALELFCEKGVDGTTMHQLADHAEVSYGLFYHYFTSKDEVLQTAVRQTTVLPLIEEFLSHHEQSARTLLMKLPSFYLEVMETRREIVWLLFTESKKRPGLAEKLSELAVDFRKTLSDYLEARAAHGEIREGVDVDVATRLIWSYLFMRFLWIEDEPDAEQHMAIILNGLCS